MALSHFICLLFVLDIKTIFFSGSPAVEYIELKTGSDYWTADICCCCRVHYQILNNIFLKSKILCRFQHALELLINFLQNYTFMENYEWRHLAECGRFSSYEAFRIFRSNLLLIGHQASQPWAFSYLNIIGDGTYHLILL